MQHILENSSRFTLKKSPYTTQYSIFEPKDGIDEFDIYANMLAVVIGTVENYQNKDIDTVALKAELDKFLTYLILANSFPFTRLYKIKAYKFLIANPFTFTSAEQASPIEHANSLIMRVLDSILRKFTETEAFNQEYDDNMARAENGEAKMQGNTEEEKMQVISQLYEEINVSRETEQNEASVLL